MKKTERKHWQNGHQVRGGWFHTVNLSCYFFGVMLSWGELPNGYRNNDALEIEIFRLI